MRTTTGQPFPFAECTLSALQARMVAGTLTSAELTAAYLERIAAVDQAGPGLNAVIELNPEAADIAQGLDRERQAGRVRGPMHGIPVLLKDNIATADRMETTAGSLALVGARPRKDAPLVVQLRAAGAVILGKTNLSEWANFRGLKSISGWSARGGQTRNPYALDRSPSGSSSGSAVAVSANLCVVAVGTETDGSIVSPSSLCGIVGVKPTVGLVSRTGIIPIAAAQDTAGPMTRNVHDAALLLEAMAGMDDQDPITSTRPAGYRTDFAAQLQPAALRGARLGVIRGPFGMDPRLNPLLDAAISQMRAAGAEIEELGEMSHYGKIREAEIEVLHYEFKAGLNAYLAGLGEGASIRSLTDLIAFNQVHRAEELAAFGQERLLQADAKGPLTDPIYLTALDTCRRLTRTEGIDALLAKHRLDALVTLTAGPAWLIDPLNGDTPGGGSSPLAAVAGYPSVTVPAADFRGLPVGISFTGPAWTEAKLLAYAADFERINPVRRPPDFPATLNPSSP